MKLEDAFGSSVYYISRIPGRLVFLRMSHRSHDTTSLDSPRIDNTGRTSH
jgi:hypothetical protein